MRCVTARKIIRFKYREYIRDLEQELRKAMYRVRDAVHQKALEYAARLPFKDNEVKLADGSTTSDAERAGAFLSSILVDRVSWEMNRTVLKTAVFAMRDNFKESHIGFYYEYGTGTKEDPDSPIFSIGDGRNFNTFRLPVVGSRIVTRSKYVNGGVWEDLGGNKRITNSPRGGEYDQGFREYIGEDIEPHHWFERAYQESIEYALNEFREAVKRVPVSNYFILPRKYVIGRKR